MSAVFVLVHLYSSKFKTMFLALIRHDVCKKKNENEIWRQNMYFQTAIVLASTSGTRSAAGMISLVLVCHLARPQLPQWGSKPHLYTSSHKASCKPYISSSVVYSTRLYPRFLQLFVLISQDHLLVAHGGLCVMSVKIVVSERLYFIIGCLFLPAMLPE